MKSKALSVMAGVVAGMALLLLVLFQAGPALMILEDDSPHSQRHTVDKILLAAEQNHWKVPKVHDLQLTLQKVGEGVAPATVIELCQPEHAAKVLQDFSARKVSAMMPCRVAVYQTEDGRVVVSRMNTGLISQVFGGTVTEVMRVATLETETIIEQALNPEQP